MSSDREINEFPRPRYGIRLFFKHPNIDPNKITQALSLEPTHAWMPGSKKVTPIKNPRIANDSYWNYRIIVDNQERGLTIYLEEIIATLERNESLIRDVTGTSGYIEVDIQLYGGAHVSDVINPALLGRIAALKINLGIEVFPNWN